MDPPNRHAIGRRIFDDFRRATASCRGLAVPDRDQKIAIADHETPDILISAVLVLAIAIEREPILAGAREQGSEFSKIFLRRKPHRFGSLGGIDAGEIPLIFLLPERHRNVEAEIAIERTMRDQSIG